MCVEGSMKQVPVIFCSSQSFYLHNSQYIPFTLTISLKLLAPFDNMPLVFASYDCKTLLRAILKKNFVSSVSAAEMLLLCAN